MQAWQNSNLICTMSIPIHIPNLKSISRKTAEKSPENYIFTKGNNSCKSRLSVMKLKLDLYYVNANSYTKFRVNISEDFREKNPLKLLNGIWKKNLSLPGSKISTSSTKFVFFGLIGRTICPRPFVGWDIGLLFGNWSMEFDETWHEAWAWWGKGVWVLGLIEKQR